MKLPREISGKQLVRALEKIGYERIRQKGSHVTLASKNGDHHVTVPLHDPLKLGMFAAIIGDVADHMKLTKEELVTKLPL